MNMNKKGISTTTAALAVVIIVVVVAAAAYVVVSPGKNNTVTQTATNTATTTYYSLTLQAGGSTFVNPLMQDWAIAFQQYTNNAVKTNYQALGSGAGITGILKGTFEFAGSDAPVPASQSTPNATAHGQLLQIPETLGGVAIFYNIPGVKVSLNLTGPIIAKIYLGAITRWNDSTIAALNPGCHTGSTTCVLPSNTIVPVHRVDGSGTTYALTNYFEKVSTDWNASFTTGCPCYGTSVSGLHSSLEAMEAPASRRMS